MNSKTQKTILLVEDESIIGMSQSMSLKKFGYDVTHVLNGQKAIDIVNDAGTNIDLILMDIDLGKGLDGTETAEKILKKHDLPILFLSNHTERDIVEKTRNITSYGYVVKNSGITVLDASIKMAFRLYKSYLEVKNQKIEIEEKKKELQYYEKRYRRLFEAAKDGILILDAASGMIVDVNPYLVEILGYTKEQFLRKKIWDINAFKNIDYSKYLFKELQNKEYIRFTDLPLETIDGKLIYVEFVSNVYLVDGEKVIQCNIRDITDRRKYEKSLTNHIDEKASLLKELQHRTKNSFNLITSLMALRSLNSESEETRNTLEELTLRVKSISDLYTLLYDTDSFEEVKLSAYCSKVIESTIKLKEKITINKSIDDITMSAKDAATFGMILVELLSNSIKYAFPENKQGCINIDVKKINSKIILSISDDGIGLPKDFDINNAKTLGLHLVKLMVSQLLGKIKLTSDNGTKIIIEFPA